MQTGWSGRIRCLLMFSVIFPFSERAPGDTVVIGPIKDNTIYSENDNANGAGQHLFAGRTGAMGSGSIRRALIAFDIAGNVPANMTINNVTLQLHMSRTTAGPEVVSLHRILADWGEGTSNASGEEGQGAPAEFFVDATWNFTVFPFTLWASPGGDFIPASSSVQVIGGVADYTWPSTPTLVADVQLWLDNPADNFGWLLMGNEAVLGTTKRFDTRENPLLANRPTLAIEFGGVQNVCMTCPGDSDGSDSVNGADIQMWLDCMIAGDAIACPCADMDGDQVLNLAVDMPMFISRLLDDPPCR